MKRNYLTKKHIEFLNWILITKYNELKIEHKSVIRNFTGQTINILRRGYGNGSPYQMKLNEIRNLYLKEYQQARY